jgi:hypothetical protein
MNAWIPFAQGVGLIRPSLVDAENRIRLGKRQNLPVPIERRMVREIRRYRD